MRAPGEVTAAKVVLPESSGNPAEVLWNVIIRPPRATYTPNQLGPTHFCVHKTTHVRRSDFELHNPRGHALQCSFFEPLSQSQWEFSRRQRFAEAAAQPDASATSEPPAAVPAEGAAQGTAAEQDVRADPDQALQCGGVQLCGSRPPESFASRADGAAGRAVARGTHDNPMGLAPATSLTAVGSSSRPGVILPLPPGETREALPCVIFLHGNSSCRLEAFPLVSLLLPLKISLFCFDFSGCGMSQGAYISLGWFEREDLATCIEFLRSQGCVSRIALWGRSMGAFTALLYADRDPSIAGMVLDSPFVSLTVLAEELARSFAKVPAWMVRAVLPVVRSMIQKKGDFDIQDLEAVQHVSHSFSPALFIAASGDDFILPHHAKELCEAYQGEKELHMISGDHNSVRPEACRKKAALFLCRAFQDSRLDRLLELHVSGLFDIFAGAAKLPVDGDASPGVGDDTAYLCKQLRIFPALRVMRLLNQVQCRRPFVASADIRLQEDNSEAGFFLRLNPVAVEGVIVGGARYLMVTVSAQALIVSRVCDDDLETIAAADGLPKRQVATLKVSMDQARSIRVHLGDRPPLDVSCSTLFHDELTLWLMLLHGLTQCSPVHVDDGEATIREGLGDLLLRERHLGAAGNHISGNHPARCPNGDVPAMLPCSTFSQRRGASGANDAPDQGFPGSCSVTGGGGDSGGCCDTRYLDMAMSYAGASAPQGSQDSGAVMQETTGRPEALIGWRVRIHAHGEGIVVGVKRRRGRSTQHVILCTGAVTASDTQSEGWFRGSKPRFTPGCFSTVLLRRREKYKIFHRGYSYVPVRKLW